MANYFISQGRDEIPRWREAFATARYIGPGEASAHVAEGDLAWVVCSQAAWPALVSELAKAGARVAVLSYRPEAREAMQALEAGARGYAHVLSPPALLRQLEVVVANQGVWVPPELMARVVGGAFQALGGLAQTQLEELEVLTERERAVTLAVLEGQSNKEVARELGITERTVKAHLGAVFHKLGVRDRMQLLRRLSRVSGALLDTGQA
jgi:DNA-binding NarL/FixJ family response regulator